MKTAWRKHGGKSSIITSVLEEKGLSTADLMDLSANINPLGIPDVMKERMKAAVLEESMTYPDLTYRLHREQIAQYEGVPFEKILLTNGGAEAIYLSAAWLRGKKVAILSPSFSEYEQACQANDVDYTLLMYEEYFYKCTLPKQMEEIIQQYDALYVCRPNNPSGTCLSFEQMKELLRLAHQFNTYILTDEAFIHFAEDEKSVISLCAEFENLLIFRSLTKIFAVPGIRLGYVIADESIIEAFSKLQIPWSVNTVALSLIDSLEQCSPFIQETVAFIKQEKQWLSHAFQSLDMEMSKTCTNFYLLRDRKLSDQERLLLYLAKKGILARHTYNFPFIEGNALRFAIRSRKENERLVQSLKEWRTTTHG